MEIDRNHYPIHFVSAVSYQGYLINLLYVENSINLRRGLVLKLCLSLDRGEMYPLFLSVLLGLNVSA